MLNDNDWRQVIREDGSFKYRLKSCIDKYPYSYIVDGKRITVNLTEKRLLTYNPSLAAKKRFETQRMIEKAQGLIYSQAKRKDYGECGKYVNFTDETAKKAQVVINQEAIDKDLSFAGCNLFVTSEIKMSDKDNYNTYHNLSSKGYAKSTASDFSNRVTFRGIRDLDTSAEAHFCAILDKIKQCDS